ncbi:MAG: tetrahydromethanopterin S-methyltransferase subunit D, partial [Methanosarcinaceae archaeon]|nr:tetrahydromethanopterin S-methyltransferase subunit D [Methanosarcinaceae archaeon]
GIGGSLIYYALMKVGIAATSAMTSDVVGLVAIFAVGIFFVNAVIPSYNIGGTIEGFHDPKWKKWPKAVVSSFVATIFCALVAVVAISQLGGL